MTIVKIENGIVTQVDHSKSEAPAGWAVAPESVVVGQIDNGDGTFSNPKPTVSRVADDKVAELKTACRDAIFAGFDSDALGGVHHYPCKQGGGNFDQINLNGQVSKSQLDPNGTFKFMCEVGGVWARREHTATQIQRVGLAGAEHVTTQQDNLEVRLAEVATIQSNDTLTDDEKKTQINAITW